MIMELLPILVSLLALVFSAVAWRKSHKVEREMLELEKRRDESRELEERRANLTAAIVGDDASLPPWRALEIRNGGPAEARHVRVEFDGTPAAEHPAVGQYTPIDVLGAGSAVRVRLVSTLGRPLPSAVELRWEDDSSTDRVYRTRL